MSLFKELIIRAIRLVRKALKWFFVLPPGWPHWRKILWRVFNLALLFFIYLFIVDINFLWLFGKSPKIGIIFNPEIKITSELYSEDGKLLAKYFDENRQPLKYEEIPEGLLKALVATEDERFYHHFGIDAKASLSVIWYMIKGERRGGSTITQQLVKNLFKTRKDYSTGLLGRIPLLKVIIYKTKEWTAALKTEFFYSKKEIITLYCNTIDFGNNSFGLKTAAHNYYSLNPANLKIEQYATLIGILKAPSYYSPTQHPDRAMDRRNIVFDQMCKAHLLTAAARDSLKAVPLALNMKRKEPGRDESSYLRDAVSNQLRDWLKENNYDLYTDGLKITCSIDSKIQAYAEEALEKQMKVTQQRFKEHLQGRPPWNDRQGNEIPNYIENIAKGTAYFEALTKKYPNQPDSVSHYLGLPHAMTVFSWKGDRDTSLSFMDSIRYYQHFLHSGFIAMDPNTGRIKAWVGGINHKYFKFDHVYRSKRQPGSTFKAFVYSAAIDGGYGPCDTRVDVPVTYQYTEKGAEKSWSPKNADWNFTGRTVTLKHAFARSINSIAVQITKEIGWKKVIEYAYRMGIKTPLQDVPSVCLGSSDVSLYELVNAYCTMVNGGSVVEAVLVTRIEDQEGRVIYTDDGRKKRAIKEETAFYMQQMLMAGLTEPGATTGSLWEYDIFKYNTDIGGKTGTSSNHSDGWFIGITPKLVAGAWVGGESRNIHFTSSALGEGNRTALPIVGRFLEMLLKDAAFKEYRTRFPKPAFKLNKSYTCHTVLPKEDSLTADSLMPLEEMPPDE